MGIEGPSVRRTVNLIQSPSEFGLAAFIENQNEEGPLGYLGDGQLADVPSRKLTTLCSTSNDTEVSLVLQTRLR